MNVAGLDIHKDSFYLCTSCLNRWHFGIVKSENYVFGLTMLLSFAIYGALSNAQDMRLFSIGIRLLPSSVKEYSTFGGISAYSFLLTNPSASRFLNVSVRTFGEISGIALLIVLKRVASFSESTHNMSIAHLLENRDRTFRIGQFSIRVYFFRFSCTCKLFISNNNYFKVSGLHFCNFLFINI